MGARETPGRCEYFLTDKGQALGPVLKALYERGEALWMKSSSGCALGRFQKSENRIKLLSRFHCVRKRSKTGLASSLHRRDQRR
ncbi:MAG: winged helix-turn-helix transcriptional regulator [Methylocella sp.]